MSKAPASIKNFLNSSNVEVRRAAPTRQAFPQRFEKKIVNNENLGEFAEFLNMSNSDNNNNDTLNIIRGINEPSLTLSGLNPGMFNATVNSDFSPDARIDLKRMLKTRPIGRTSIGEGLYIDTQELIGMYGRFKTGFSHTKEYGPKGDINLNFFTVQIKFTITNGTETKGGTVNFYKNGKIRFSGGFIGTNIANQPELIRKFMVRKYSNNSAFLYNPFTYNNLSGQFRINGNFVSLSVVAASGRKHGFEAKYTPELSPMLYIVYKGHKYIIGQSGAIQISGATNPSQLMKAYDIAPEFLESLHSDGKIRLAASMPQKLVKKRVNAKKTTCPATRRPPCKDGFNVRKNPQGDDCCYKTPKRKTKRKSPTKDIKISYDSKGNVMIGKKKCEKMTKQTLTQMAKTLGVVGIKSINKKEKICSMIKQFDLGNTNFKVGAKPCVMYKRDELVGMALSKGISVDDTDTIKSLCEKMKLNVNKKASNAIAKKRLNREVNKAIKNNIEEEKVLARRRLDNNSIKNDIVKLYGSIWMKKYKSVMNINKDVRDMNAALKKKSNNTNITNKKGYLKKLEADKIKKSIVQKWKLDRKNKYEREIAKKMYGKHGNAVVNFVITQKPTKKQIEKFIKIRENLRK